jgi:hypothetical protein
MEEGNRNYRRVRMARRSRRVFGDKRAHGRGTCRGMEVNASAHEISRLSKRGKDAEEELMARRGSA